MMLCLSPFPFYVLARFFLRSAQAADNCPDPQGTLRRGWAVRMFLKSPPLVGGDTNSLGTLALVAASGPKAGVFLRRIQ
jgi:hypothetical protein